MLISPLDTSILNDVWDATAVLSIIITGTLTASFVASGWKASTFFQPILAIVGMIVSAIASVSAPDQVVVTQNGVSPYTGEWWLYIVFDAAFLMCFALFLVTGIAVVVIWRRTKRQRFY